MSEQFRGPIKTKADAKALMKKLDTLGTPEARDAAALLDRNWRSVAARPMVAMRLEAMTRHIKNDG